MSPAKIPHPIQHPIPPPPAGQGGSTAGGIDVGAVLTPSSVQHPPGGGAPAGQGGSGVGGGGGSTDPSPGNFAPSPIPENNGSAPPTNTGSTALSFAQAENFWIQAGGNPQAASMAAAVADAESGLNAAAQRTNPDGSVGIGLWLIPQNGQPPGSTDPIANARAAVQLSQNGTDWTQWCSTWSDNNCGENNGTYLGSGANALMSLQGQKPGAAYNVFGSAPSGTGVGASSATSGLGGNSTTSSSKPNYLIFGIIILVVGAILFLANRKSKSQTSESSESEESE